MTSFVKSRIKILSVILVAVFILSSVGLIIQFNGLTLSSNPIDELTPGFDERRFYIFNMVEASSGNLFHQRGDLTLHLSNYGTYVFDRSFNTALLNNPNNLFQGWTLPFEERMFTNDTHHIWHHSDGTIREFEKNGEIGNFIGKVKEINSEYWLFNFEGIARVFHANGTLLRISLPNGHEISYTFTGSSVLISDNIGTALEFSQVDANEYELKDHRLDRSYIYLTENGYLSTVIDTLGEKTHYEYTPDGLLHRIIYPDDSGYLFLYDEYARVVEVYSYSNTSSKSAFSPIQLGVIEYNSAHTKVTDTTGGITTIEYSSTGLLTKIENSIGDVYQRTYNSNNLVASETNYDGTTVSYNYGTHNKITSITREDGSIINYNYFIKDTSNLFAILINNHTNSKGQTSLTNYTSFLEIDNVKDALGHISKYEYDVENRLSTIRYPNGATSNFTYYSNGLLHNETNRDGHSTTYSYDDGGRLTSIAYPDGSTESFVYNKESDLKEHHQKGGIIEYFSYDQMGRVVQYKDATGLTQNIAYNPYGQVVSSKTDTDVGTKDLGLQYDSFGRLVRVIEDNAKDEKYHYDLKGRLVSRVNYYGSTEHFVYDKLDRLIEHVDFRGTTTTYIYDVRGNLIQESKAGSIQTYSYDTEDNLLTYTNSRGGITTYKYDALNRLTKLTNPLGNSIFFEYDEVSNIVNTTDSVGLQVYRHYSNAGLLINETNILGETKLYTFDSLDRIIEFQDSVGGIHEFTYDLRGNLLNVVDPEGYSVQFTYDLKDRRTSKVTETGGIYNYTYNDLNLITSVTNPLGFTEQFTYDTYGNMLTHTDFSGNVTSYFYDLNNNNIEIIDSMGNPEYFSYNYLNWMTSKIDKLGNTWYYEHDAFGNVIKITDPVGNEEIKSYDSESNLIEYIDQAGNVYTYEYDINNNLIKYIAPEGVAEHYYYDSMDRIISFKNTEEYFRNMTRDVKGNIIEYIYPFEDPQTGGTTASIIYTYDPKNRITGIIDEKSNSKGFVYDLKDNLISYIMPTGDSIIYEYNGENQLISTTYPEGDVEEFTYDLVGNLLNWSYGYIWQAYEYDPMNRPVKQINFDGYETYHYDSLGRRVTEIDGEGRNQFFQYDASGNLIARIDEDGNAKTLEYDELNRITKYTLATGEEILYTFTPTSKVSTRTNGYGLTTYEYDGLDRLIKINYPDGGFVDYSYDHLGRVTEIINSEKNSILDETYYEWSDEGMLVNFTTIYRDINDPTNQHIVTILYTYDAVGNRLTRTDSNGVATYEYDERDLLIEVNDSTGAITSYEYDTNGRRTLWNSINGTTVHYYYDMSGMVFNQTVVGLFVSDPDPFYVTTNLLMEYDQAGRLITKNTLVNAFGNNITEYYYYDKSGKIIQYIVDDKFFLEPYSKNYTYNNIGLLVEVSDSLTFQDNSNPILHNYTYDASHRLISNYNGTHLFEIFYDTTGNMFEEFMNGVLYRKFYYDYEDRLIRLDDQKYYGGTTTKLYWQPESRILVQTYNDTNLNSEAQTIVWDLTHTLTFFTDYLYSEWVRSNGWTKLQKEIAEAGNRNVVISVRHHQLPTNNGWRGPYWNILESSPSHPHRIIDLYSGLEKLMFYPGSGGGPGPGGGRSPGPGILPMIGENNQTVEVTLLIPNPDENPNSPVRSSLPSTAVITGADRRYLVYTHGRGTISTIPIEQPSTTGGPSVSGGHTRAGGRTGVGTAEIGPIRDVNPPVRRDGPRVDRRDPNGGNPANDPRDGRKAPIRINLDSLIAGLIDQLLDKFIDTFIEKAISKAISTVLQAMLSRVVGKATAREIDSFIQEAIGVDTLASLLSDHIKSSSAFNRIKNAVTNNAKQMLKDAVPDWLRNLANQLLEGCNPLDVVRDRLLSELENFLKNKVGELADKIADAALKVSGVARALTALGNRLGRTIMQQVMRILANVLRFVPIIGQILTLYQIADAIWSILPDSWKNGIKQWLKDAYDTLSKVAQEAWKGISDLGRTISNIVGNVVNEVSRRGSNFVDSLGRGDLGGMADSIFKGWLY
jgi:YD repeat-containing protein